MPIDAASVKWDTPDIDPGNIQWDSTPDEGVLSKIRTAAESVMEPAATILTGAIAQPVGNLIGAGKEILTGDFGHGTAEKTATEIQNALTYRPRNPAAQKVLGNLSDLFDKSKLAGLPVAGQELPLIVQATKQQLPYLRTIPIQIANSPEVAAIKATGNLVTPNISPETQALATKFQDMGGKIPVHALSNNKFLRMAGETLDNLPLSGSTKPGNKVAFNRALIKQIGGNADDDLMTSSTFSEAMDRSGNAIGEMYKGKQIQLQSGLNEGLTALSNAQRYQVRDIRSVINSYINDIRSMADESGVIPGEALRHQDSSIGQRIRSLPPGDLRNQLSDLQESIRDALSKTLTPGQNTDLSLFRKQYAIGKVLEPLVAKSGENGISPQALLGRVTATSSGKHRMAMGAAGDIGDLANIGQRFIKEVPSSTTAERGMLVGAALDTGKALAGITAGNVYNRLSPLLSRRLVRSVPKSSLAPAPLMLEEGAYIPPSPLPYPPVKENQLLSLMRDPPETHPPYVAEGLDFPLRQEVLNSPEITAATNAFRQEAQRLQGILDNKYVIDPRVRANAAQQLNELQNEFAAGMRQLGIENAGDANGLRRMLYESGRNQLPIQKTFTP